MSLLILHGDQIVASRSALRESVEKARRSGIKDIVRLNGEKVSLGDLKQALESESLFGTVRLVIIENVLTRVRSKTKEELVRYIAVESPKGEVILWERKELTTAQLRLVNKTATVRLFKLSKAIFRFLDSIYPKNTGQLLGYYHETLKQDAPELVFYMLSRRVTSLLIAADYNGKELHAMQKWQRQRLLAQAGKFTSKDLQMLHESLYRTDVAVKTGKSILPLSSMLDLILSEI